MVFNLFHCAHVRVFLDGLFIHFKFALQCFFITVFQIFQAVAEKDVCLFSIFELYSYYSLDKHVQLATPKLFI